MRLVIWAWSACLISCMTSSFGLVWLLRQGRHIGKCCQCLAFKARQPKVPLENIVATHPLELVHLDYLCLEPGKGLEENVLVITDHFTRYAQAYVTRTQTAQMTAKTLWDKFIVHYGPTQEDSNQSGMKFWESVGGWPPVSWWGCGGYGPVHIICRPMVNVRGSTPLWSICLGLCPRRRNQSGRTTLEHWFMHIIAPKTQSWGSAPTTSCLADNLTFQ